MVMGTSEEDPQSMLKSSYQFLRHSYSERNAAGNRTQDRAD